MTDAVDPVGGWTATVGIAGLGLIGGSLLRRLAAAGVPTIGWNRDPDGRRRAAALGLSVADDLATLARASDVLVLAVPLPAFAPVLAELAPAARAGAVLTDVTSVKGAVAAVVARHAPDLRFVGGHPMAGTQESGFVATDPALFEGATWVLCEEADTDPAALELLGRIVRVTGATVLTTTAEEHDDAVARISHVPHLLAAALAATGAADALGLALAAGSFRDGTRVAATRPELSAAMCAGNREAVLAALDDVMARLARARRAVAASPPADPAADLLAFFAEGVAARRAFEHRH